MTTDAIQQVVALAPSEQLKLRQSIELQGAVKMTTKGDIYTVRRLTVEVPGVREFQRRYEEAVPPHPTKEVHELIRDGAPWSEVLELIEEAATHGFLLYWTNDVHPVMQLAGDGADCISYLMGNVTIAERMFRHDPRVMLYAPLHTVIWEDAGGQSWFTADQPSTQFGSFGIPEVTSVGVELDRKLAALLETLDVEVPMTLLSEHAISPDNRQ